jgi:hypothetical protein
VKTSKGKDPREKRGPFFGLILMHKALQQVQSDLRRTKFNRRVVDRSQQLSFVSFGTPLPRAEIGSHNSATSGERASYAANVFSTSLIQYDVP